MSRRPLIFLFFSEAAQHQILKNLLRGEEDRLAIEGLRYVRSLKS